MNRENWWATPIWTTQNNIDCQSAANYCLELRKNNFPNRTRSNYGGWQSKDLILSDHAPLNDIFCLIKNGINDICADISQSFKCELNNIWININEKNNGNNEHVHPNSTFSGTIYLQTDKNTGNIIFKNPYFPIQHYNFVVPEDSNIFYQRVTYRPRNGMLIMFPAWMPHFVEPSNSDNSRISISFNINQLIKD